MIAHEERQRIVESINHAVTHGARKTKACETIGLKMRTLQRWINGGNVNEDKRPKAKRPEPANKLSEQEKHAIISCCNRVEFAHLSPNQIVPKLADQGEYLASESSFYRILKHENQLQHRGRSQVKRKISKPTSYSATTPNQVWSWDISYLPTGVIGLHYYLYLFMDIYSRKIVGADVYESENGSDAAVLLQRSMWSEKCIEKNLVLHSDNGAPMKSFTLREKMYDLGVVTSRSRPRVSNDNPYSESLFKTLKYCPQWPTQGFTSLAEARLWVDHFTTWYNEEHQHSRISYVTPTERHDGKDKAILKKRKQLYLQARKSQPSRWSGDVRKWEFIEAVELNPEMKKQAA
jgi:transposase InsO family protein